MINALAGKRVLESGGCGTTTEICLVGATNPLGAQKWARTKLVSDDGVEFCALDLPGTCDAEDASRGFKTATREWAPKCDVVVWVTDARSAFLTTHEVGEYEALRAAIQEKADFDGTMYQFCVVLAKYESDDCDTRVKAPAFEYLEGEIRTEREESTIGGNFEVAVRRFPDTRVVKFSAFSRIAACGSGALRDLVSATSANAKGANAKFLLKWATENLVEKRLAQMSRLLRETIQRAVAAETRLQNAETRNEEVDAVLGVLMSRVAPSPVYDTPFEFLFVRTRDAKGAVISDTTVFSLPVMMDGAVDDMLICGIGDETLRVSPDFMHFGVGSCHSVVSGQLIAPRVRPVYGDVFVVPLRATSNPYGQINACIKEHWGVCTDDAGVNTKYVLKVGEASPGHLRALVAIAPQGLGVRCIKK